MTDVAVRDTGSEVEVMMTPVQARRITDRIRKSTDTLAELVLEAHDREAWRALEYASWTAYVQGEFDVSVGHSGRLLWQARAIKQISAATGVPAADVALSGRAASELTQTDVDEIVAEAAMADGEPEVSLVDKAKALRESIETKRSTARARAAKPEAPAAGEVVAEAAGTVSMPASPPVGAEQAPPEQETPPVDPGRLLQAAKVLQQILALPPRQVALAYLGIPAAEWKVHPAAIGDELAMWAETFAKTVQQDAF